MRPIWQLGPGRVFASVFAYTFGVGLFIQWVLLPVLLPDLHAGHGLFKGHDWVWFHEEACVLAHRIREQGWGSWSLRPYGNAPIGVAAAVYAVTGLCQPWLLMPLNAALFGFAATLLFVMFRLLAAPREAALATGPFVLFPSAAMIYGQIHKDVWSIAGVLAVLFVWACLSARRQPSRWQSAGLVLLTGCGAASAWFVRPYLAVVLCGVSLPSTAILAACGVRSVFRRAGSRPSGSWWAAVGLSQLVLLAFSLLLVRGVPFAPAAPQAPPPPTAGGGILEKLVQALAAARRAYAAGYPEAGSNIDVQVTFTDAWDVVGYAPRALLVGLLAPFPSMWTVPGKSPGGAITRRLAGLETAVGYVLFPGLLLLWARSPGTMATMVAACSSFLIVHALVVTNVGALYRLRYGCWHVLVGLGLIGWRHVLQRPRRR